MAHRTMLLRYRRRALPISTVPARSPVCSIPARDILHRLGRNRPIIVASVAGPFGKASPSHPVSERELDLSPLLPGRARVCSCRRRAPQALTPAFILVQDRVMVRTFTVVLERGERGWWVAHVPALHATAQGRSRSTTLRRARALIAFAVEDMRSAGQPFPTESSRVEFVRVRASA